jgi:hypothetical protein
MATKRPKQQAQKGTKKPQSPADSAEAVSQAAPSAKDRKRSKILLRRKKKLAAAATAGVQVASAVGGMQAATSLTQQAIQAARHIIDSPSDQLSGPSGDEYFVSEEWRGYSASTTASQISAERMAKETVAIALKAAGRSRANATMRRHLVQWVLAGNITPAQAATIIAGDSAASQPLEGLKREIAASVPLQAIKKPRDRVGTVRSDHSIENGILALVKEVAPGAQSSYIFSINHPARIGLGCTGADNRFMEIESGGDTVSIYFRISHFRQVTALIRDSGIQFSGYKDLAKTIGPLAQPYGEYRITLTTISDLTTYHDLLIDLIRRAQNDATPWWKPQR